MILATNKTPLLKKIKQLKDNQIKCYNCFTKIDPTYNYLNGIETAYCSECDEDLTEHLISVKSYPYI